MNNADQSKHAETRIRRLQNARSRLIEWISFTLKNQFPCGYGFNPYDAIVRLDYHISDAAWGERRVYAIHRS